MLLVLVGFLGQRPSEQPVEILRAQVSIPIPTQQPNQGCVLVLPVVARASRTPIKLGEVRMAVL